MREKIRQTWQSLTMKKKIAAFTGTVFLIIILSVVFDIWVVKFSLVDLNGILQDNAKTNELVQALEEENRLFESCMKNPDGNEMELLEKAIKRTNKAVYALPFSYTQIGERRYAKTWSIRNSYEIYCERRDAVLKMKEEHPGYISSLYEVYDMQQYLLAYARTLMDDTIEEGDGVYQKKATMIISVPIAVVIFGVVLLCGMLKLAGVMNSTMISPILKLADTAQEIAANHFFVADVVVENEDELGELVRAFNKMKYATGEYILALEEQRKTLDLLHEEELEKLETEKRLEMTKLELLKNQIQPHFLFNTLNVIGGMANIEDAVTTEKMIKALSSLFRYNLKTPQAEVSLAQELKVVRDYMYLQEMRFGNRITYQVKCEVNEELVMIPTFLFQPLVENAIIHGLAPKEEGGMIRIHIRQREQRLCITVGDNGVGMKTEELQELRSRLCGEEEGEVGIGLGNVYHRIYAMYPESKIEVYSRENVGTVIRIAFPKK